MLSSLKSEESSGQLQLVEREDMEDEEDLFKAIDKLKVDAENGKELIATEKGKEVVAKTGAKVDATYATEKGGKEVIEEAKTSAKVDATYATEKGGKEVIEEAKTSAKVDATYATEKRGKEVIEEAKTSGVEYFLPDIEDMGTSKGCVGCPMKSKCKRKFNE